MARPHLSDLPYPTISIIWSFFELQEILDLGKLCKVFRLSCENYVRQSLKLLGWKTLGEYPIAEYLEIAWKQWHMVKRVDSNDHMTPVALTSFNCVKYVVFGQYWIAVLDHYGQVFRLSGSSEYVILPIPGRVRHIVASDSVLTALSYDETAWYVSRGVVHPIPLTNVKYIAQHRGWSVCATEQEVYTFSPSNLTQLRTPVHNSPIAQLEANSSIIIVRLSSGQVLVKEPQLIILKDNLFNKPMAIIAVGAKHSVALQRFELPPLAAWSAEQIAIFFTSKGFEDCWNTLKYHHIGPDQLIKADDDFCLNVLGIREEPRRRKLLLLLSQWKDGYVGEVGTLWGWGLNDQGQLGERKHKTRKPVKLPDLTLQPSEFISQISWGNNRTIVLTSNHRVFNLGHSSSWTDMTPQLSQQGAFIISDISQGLDQLALVVSKNVNQFPHREKMRLGSQILNYLRGKQTISEYTIGYEDRFLGVLEVSAAEYRHKDFPEHRLRYFKRRGKVVWDRKTKLDIL